MPGGNVEAVNRAAKERRRRRSYKPWRQAERLIIVILGAVALIEPAEED
jgi:hypothetical protein